MEIDRIDMRFSLEAGALIRGTVRNHLNKLKRDLMWEDGLIDVNISEDKYLITSTFEVQIHHILEPNAIDVKKAVERYVAQLG